MNVADGLPFRRLKIGLKESADRSQRIGRRAFRTGYKTSDLGSREPGTGARRFVRGRRKDRSKSAAICDPKRCLIGSQTAAGLERAIAQKRLSRGPWVRHNVAPAVGNIRPAAGARAPRRPPRCGDFLTGSQSISPGPRRSRASTARRCRRRRRHRSDRPS